MNLLLNHVSNGEELLNGATKQVRILNETINDNAVGFLQAELFLNDSSRVANHTVNSDGLRSGSLTVNNSAESDGGFFNDSAGNHSHLI